MKNISRCPGRLIIVRLLADWFRVWVPKRAGGVVVFVYISRSVYSNPP